MSLAPQVLQRVAVIRDDRINGASFLAREAARVLQDAAARSQAPDTAALLAEQAELAQLLMAARPAMASVYNMVKRLQKTAAPGEPGLEATRHFITTAAETAIRESEAAVDAIARVGAGLLTRDRCVLTHSYSATVLAVLGAARQQNPALEVIVTRSGAGRTGERAARELAGCGYKVTFIDDTALCLVLDKADKVLVGADRICADGSLVNGVGTCLVAMAARRYDIPLYACCETLKFDPRLSGDEVEIEEKDPAEVAPPGTLPSRVTVRNLYFDLTPRVLIFGVITEKGVIAAADLKSPLAPATAGRGRPGQKSPSAWAP
jgi:ribose 1,5-bisphosphate isomerase